MRRTAHSLPAILVAAGLTASVLTAPVQAAGGTRSDPAVIISWNTIATRTIFTENATPIPAAPLYYSFVSLAVYDAVVAIEGRYQPYLRQPRVHGRASSEAAAVTAAYEVLRYYFPASAGHLTTDHTASLNAVPDGRAKTAGIAVGRTAAAKLIRARQGDGRGAAITFDRAPAIGVWRPTPEAFAPMAVPWLGFVRPLVLNSPTQLRLPGPDPLRSKDYAREFAEVKAMGSATGSHRTGAQTETAMFWSANAVLQYQVSLGQELGARGWSFLRTARAFALLGTGTADALVSCWRAKYDYGYWRPITAIRLAGEDGNRATKPDPTWTPLVPTPPYPDYVSGHACVTGAATETFGHLFGRRSIDVDIASSVTATTRHYRTTAALDAETMNARIWLGLHFRQAMVDGNRLGHRAAAWTIAHELR
ncbi:vanadium-dependent haloperoxidase [Kribbella lupini]|uniref:Vanadium-dependent haloperoxidase n=1 Tax=Kribbella lupini TaxID=291602 RepID=A0ABN2AAH1_9ACTN